MRVEVETWTRFQVDAADRTQRGRVAALVEHGDAAARLAIERQTEGVVAGASHPAGYWRQRLGGRVQEAQFRPEALLEVFEQGRRRLAAVYDQTPHALYRGDRLQVQGGVRRQNQLSRLRGEERRSSLAVVRSDRRQQQHPRRRKRRNRLSGLSRCRMNREEGRMKTAAFHRR